MDTGARNCNVYSGTNLLVNNVAPTEDMRHQKDRLHLLVTKTNVQDSSKETVTEYSVDFLFFCILREEKKTFKGK